MGSGSIRAFSKTYTKINGLANFVPCPPFYPIVFLFEFYVGNDNIDKRFTEKLGVLRNCNLDIVGYQLQPLTKI